jgi:hypothetical protein
MMYYLLVQSCETTKTILDLSSAEGASSLARLHHSPIIETLAAKEMAAWFNPIIFVVVVTDLTRFKLGFYSCL